ncbi:unnamed protein product [Ectocarpus fasciculatus]
MFRMSRVWGVLRAFIVIPTDVVIPCLSVVGGWGVRKFWCRAGAPSSLASVQVYMPCRQLNPGQSRAARVGDGHGIKRCELSLWHGNVPMWCGRWPSSQGLPDRCLYVCTYTHITFTGLRLVVEYTIYEPGRKYTRRVWYPFILFSSLFKCPT